MPYFDRFDICAAHLAVETHYHVSGWLQERPSNRRRMEATHVQLHRMGYRPAPTHLGKRVHWDALPPDVQRFARQTFPAEWLAQSET